VVAEMWRRGGATEEEPRPYLKTILCRVVSIAAVTRVAEGGQVRLALRSLPDGAVGGTAPRSEAEILARFLDGVGKQKPQLVGFNSVDADLRILVQRAVAHGVAAPEFARRPDKPWEGVDYFAGGDWHVDLIEVVGGRGRSRPSLHELAVACGIPGKFTGEGAQVVDLWQAGQLGQIIAYNEFDAVTTYLVWLRVVHFAGFLSAEEYGREQDRVAELLQGEATRGRPHLADYLVEWERRRRPTSPAGSTRRAVTPEPADPQQRLLL
ncbi:MAG: 3'-5' exonuclease, partial [Gemmatimonadota bacterium]